MNIIMFEKTIKVIVILISSFYLLKRLKYIYYNKNCFQNYFYLIVYVFFVFPMILQFIFPNHRYTSFIRANEAMDDIYANIIYDVFIFLFIIVINRSKQKKIIKLNFAKNCYVTKICSSLMLIIFLYIIITNNPLVFLKYGAGYSGSATINEDIIGLGTLSFLVLVAFRKNLSKKSFIISTIIELFFFWVVGKRYIIAETLMVSIIIVGLTSQISGKRIIKLLIISGIFLLIFCSLYGILLKGNFNSISDYFLVDFSRQYTLIYQFHCQLIDKSISVNKNDSFLYLIAFWIPRSFWESKPYPFVNQLTYSLISRSDSPSNINVGWATTCSIFSDMFDSFSYFGIILCFLLFIFLFKKINQTKKPQFLVLLTYFTIRLVTVQISSAIIQISIFSIILLLADIFHQSFKISLKSKTNKVIITKY